MRPRRSDASFIRIQIVRQFVPYVLETMTSFLRKVQDSMSSRFFTSIHITLGGADASAHAPGMIISK